MGLLGYERRREGIYMGYNAWLGCGNLDGV